MVIVFVLDPMAKIRCAKDKKFYPFDKYKNKAESIIADKNSSISPMEKENPTVRDGAAG